MTSRQLITVFGATGVQGGSVIRTILSHPILSKTYNIRAITRTPNSKAAQAVQSLNRDSIEVVKADLDDKTSVVTSVAGSSIVFGVTNFWAHANFDRDVQQGRNIADAAKQAGVELLIWSSLAHVERATNGRLRDAKAFDSKAVVEEYIRTLGVPAVFYMSGVYMQNLKIGTRKTPPTYTISMPIPSTTLIPLIDAASDTGRYVAAILLAQSDASARQKLLNQRIAAASAFLTPAQFTKIITDISGLEVNFKQLPDEVFLKIFPPVPDSPNAARYRLGAMKLLRDWTYFTPGGDPSEGDRALKEGWNLLESQGLGEPTAFNEFVKNNSPWSQE